MNEIAEFFDTLADRWDELCFHDPEKLNYMLERSGLRPGMQILDVGCGTGVMESYLLPYTPARIVAVDLSPQMIRQAQQKYQTSIVDFRCTDVLDLVEEAFDYVLIYSAFPHFEDPEKLIRHLAGLCKPGGKLVIGHSESRQKINGHHHKQAGKISFSLPAAEQLIPMISRFFTVDHAEDSEQLYLVCGTRN